MKSNESSLTIKEIDSSKEQEFSLKLDERRIIKDVYSKTFEVSQLFIVIVNFINILQPQTILRYVKDALRELLLPIGYPESVCPEYIRFQFWDTSQEACGYFRGILSHQAWLTAIGVGNAQVTVVGAVFMTMVVDYSGMLSGLWFAGSPQRIRMFSANQKFWTMIKEIIQLVNTVLTISAAASPDHIIKILIVGRIFGTLAGVIDGCCTSTLVTHIARRNNFSDCKAKEGNQSRALKLVLILVAYRFLVFVNETGSRVLIAFTLLSFGKLFFQYKAMSTLQLRTLSLSRLYHCIDAWWSNDLKNMEISEVASKESILLPPKTSIVNVIGSPISTLQCPAKYLVELIKIHESVKHILVAMDAHGDVQILLKEGATMRDGLVAYIHACAFHVECGKTSIHSNPCLTTIQTTLERVQKESENISESLKKFGWDIDNLSLLPITTYRVCINSSSGSQRKKTK